MFDDGWKTQYKVAYKYMHKKKIRGSIAIIPSLIGEPDYMDKNELYRLYNDNWDLLNHTYNHIILNKNNKDDQLIEINKGDKWLKKNSFINPNKILIYPEGKYNSNTINIMEKLNYVSGRSVDEGFNPKIPTDMYNIKVKNVLTGIKPEEVNSWIDYAIKNNLTVILLFHKLENDFDELLMKYKVKDFYKIIDYIDSRRKDLNIITYSDWIQCIKYSS
jgi:peptidoglycan/xylan/chitin deacetylase (PgdA/CDA1 family)